MEGEAVGEAQGRKRKGEMDADPRDSACCAPGPGAVPGADLKAPVGIEEESCIKGSMGTLLAHPNDYDCRKTLKDAFFLLRLAK